MTAKLTREEIERMSAEELRLAVAEYVMGWKWFESANGYSYMRKKSSDIVYGAVMSEAGRVIEVYASSIPNYPGDIGAAWLVWRELQRRGYYIVINSTCDLDKVDLVLSQNMISEKRIAIAFETFGIAICRAAIMAVMSERE